MIKVKEYLVAAYNLPDSALDEFGWFARSNSSRLPVAPYTVYYTRSDLKFVDSCRSLNRPPSEFYALITRQRHTVPKEILY